VHNPFKKPERYNMLAEVCFNAAAELSKPEVEDYFIKAIQRVMPKSRTQAFNEVHVSRIFLKTFAGDGVRFMARGFTVSGDHEGQESRGYRWPFGAVAIVCPFNFPFEIPVLQLMGALFMGNKPVIKGAEKVSPVLEQYIRLLHHCGMEPDNVDLLHSRGATMQSLIQNKEANIRLTQFTGSAAVAEKLSEVTRGKCRIEDAGFDWKIVGPDVKSATDVKYVASVCDQDAYALSGQKCSAQSMLFAHRNAIKGGLLDQMDKLVKRRSLEDLTISPVLSLTTDYMLGHMNKLLQLSGAKLLWGGKPLENHTIPDVYGAIEPTAVFVPLKSMLSSPEAFALCTTEIFGPFQVVTEFGDEDVDSVLEACERMSHHLTAAVVSNDVAFKHKILANTVNGTTYHGIRARTTGAPANHWFGPCGDPRGAGIGTPEAIRLVWSAHREVIQDDMPPPADFTPPPAT